MKVSYRWKVLGLAIVMQALIVGISVYCFGFFVVHWMNEFSRPRSELMIAYTAMSFMAGIFAPMVGVLIDKYSKRVLVLIGAVSFALGLLLLSRAQAPWFVVGVFGLIFPLAMSLSGPLMAQTLVANAFEQNRGTALGICTLGTSIGGFAMPVLVTAMLGFYEWRQVFVMLAIIIAVGVVPMAFFILKSGSNATALKSTSTVSFDTKKLLSDSNIYKLAFAYFVPSFLFVGVLQNMALLAVDLHLSEQQAGWVVSIAAGLMAVGKFLVGWLADRVSHSTIYNAIIVFVGLSMYLTATADHFLALVFAVAALGTSVGGLSPLIGAIVSRRYGMANFGRVMGVVMGAASLSGLAPLLAGWLRDSTGSYEATFLWFLPMIVPAIIAFNCLSNSPKNKKD